MTSSSTIPTTYTFSVPGRLCLTGEHSDWAADFRPQNPSLPSGAALVVALTSEYLTATVTSSSSTTTSVNISSKLAGALKLTSSTQALSVARDENNPWRFASSVVYLMLTRYTTTMCGLNIKLIKETLPSAKGFSSSAAICILVTRAFNLMYNLNLTHKAEMDIAYLAERVTGSSCGRMDQIVAIAPGRIASMTFDMDFVDYQLLHINNNANKIYIVVTDLGKAKNTKLILHSLQKAYPNAGGQQGEKLRNFLGNRNLFYVNQMKQALLKSDAKKLGSLMTSVQNEFDNAAIPFCVEELSAPYLHAILNDSDVQPLVYGGKGVGSQGDGAVQFVARDKECAEHLVHVLHQKLGTTATIVTPGVEPESISRILSNRQDTHGQTDVDMYEQIETAVVPTAGYGTRLFPASKVVRPKGLLPIVDSDGYAKPILLHIIEQAVSAGIKKVIIVSAPGIQEESVRSIVAEPDAELKKRLKPIMKEYSDRIVKLQSKIDIAIQSSAEGFGHAVSCAFPNVSSDNVHDQYKRQLKWKPFLLLLGDVVFTKKTIPVQQVLDEFHKYNGKNSIIGVTTVSIKIATSYGVVCTTKPLKNNGHSEEISQMIEKPSKHELEKLCTKDSKTGEAVCDIVLGPYALTGLVMDALKRNVELDIRDGGEIQLTSALNEVMGVEGMRAVRLQCEALDTGNAKEYVRTFTRLGSGMAS